MTTYAQSFSLPLVERYRPPSLPPRIWLAALTCLLMILHQGCSSNQRRETLARVLLTVDTASTSFTAWDAAHQSDLVEKATSYEQGAAALEDYRKRRAPVLLAFELAYQAIAVAALAEDDAGVARAKERLQQLLELITILSASSE